MAQMDGETLFLTAQEILQHNENAKSQQKLLQEILSKRADIEFDYLSSLAEWQKHYESLINSEEFLYTGEIRDVFLLLSREAESAANIHHNIFNKIYTGGCNVLKTAISATSDTPMKSKIQKKADTILSEFSTIEKKHSELLQKLKRAKQNKNYAVAAKRDVEEQVNGQKRYGTVPLTTSKIESLKERLVTLDKNVETHNNNVIQAETVLSRFFNSNEKKLAVIVKDLEEVSANYLDTSIQSLQNTLSVFREQEDVIVRNEKQKLLFKSDQLLSRVKTFKGHCLDKVKSKVATQISSADLSIRQVQPFLDVQNGGETTCGIAGDGHVSHGLPEGSSGPSASTAMFPPSRNVKSTHSTPVNVGDDGRQPSKRPVHTTRTVDALYSEAPTRPGTTDTVEAFYTGSDDSIEDRKAKREAKRYNRYKEIPDTPWIDPTIKSSRQSLSSIESIDWIEEQVAPYKDEMRSQVRDFCMPEDCSDESDQEICTSKTRIKKICEDTTSTSEDECDVVDDDSVEEDVKNHEVFIDDFTNVQDVTHRRNSKVIARFDYTARKPGELSFKKGQIIKQKLGKDEYGFSYGWTRASKFVHKQHGYYPSELVTSTPISDYRMP